ncbi:MAG: hypothetical protein ABMA64_07095 [Myxococcota bacterium]
MILEIERAWHQVPGWFGTLDQATRARLMAWWRVTHPAPSPAASTSRKVRQRR